MTNATHRPDLRSWVESANKPGADFPIQNLPLGVFRDWEGDESPRVGVAIGKSVLDVSAIRAVLEQAQAVHGMAHNTGGGLQENVARILPAGCRAGASRGGRMCSRSSSRGRASRR